MDNWVSMLKMIVPEIEALLEKRYSILKTVSYNQPIGRRLLAERLVFGERVIRSEVDFLKSQQLLISDTTGVSLAPDGEILMLQLDGILHNFRGLESLETYLAEKVGLEKVYIVAGDVDKQSSNMREIGKKAGEFISKVVRDDWVVAVTGGTTMAEVACRIPISNSSQKVLVVPARGGLGEVVEIQSNAIAAVIAERLGGTYRLLYVPDYISEEVLENLLLDCKIQETISLAKNANLLLHGIGVPKIMAARRDIDWHMLLKQAKELPAGEAFGYYFADDGTVAATTPTVGPKLEDLTKLNMVVAVAAGKSKARAILAVLRAGFVKVLITDQGAAESIKEILEAEI
ncbi:MAG: sugar-binding domain-containing protein [Clostridia bacterium]|nr:sugar-binding domain-containing protein [Clostridia bacterium]MDD4047548.1 sugar-binding domain-containing protein [Clostridia bacterium]